MIQTVQLHHFHVLQLKSIKVQLGQLKARRLIQPEDIPVPIVSGDKEVCHFTGCWSISGLTPLTVWSRLSPCLVVPSLQDATLFKLYHPLAFDQDSRCVDGLVIPIHTP